MSAVWDIDERDARYERDYDDLAIEERCGSCNGTPEGECTGCGYFFCADCITHDRIGSWCPDCIQLTAPPRRTRWHA